MTATWFQSTGEMSGEWDTRPLRAAEFEQIRRLAYEKFGLNLRDGKQELVKARLGKLLRSKRLRTFQQYLDLLQQDRTGESLIELINALTTNYTQFMREPKHFDFLKSVVAPLAQSQEPVYVWSAACSTGEEPYSIVFCLLEALGPGALRRIHVEATDISTRVLETARRGIYPAERIQSLPDHIVRRCLLRGRGEWEGYYRIKPDVRDAVEFRRLNLVEFQPRSSAFHIIFCRNVMIYFDREVQARVVAALEESLRPGGYLFIGHAESLSAVDHGLQYVQPAIYRKPAGEAVRRRGG